MIFRLNNAFSIRESSSKWIKLCCIIAHDIEDERLGEDKSEKRRQKLAFMLFQYTN